MAKRKFLLLTGNYGVVMKKNLSLFAGMVSLLALSGQTYAEGENKFELDESSAAEFQLKETLQKDTAPSITPVAQSETSASADSSQTAPDIIREDIEGGYVEKLMSPEGQVIAEKTVKDDKIVKKVLNYYTPEGVLQRRITAKDGASGFYAEDFYSNGNIASQAHYLNEDNKIGKEQKYDINGVLRQELVWVLPKSDNETEPQNIRTIRYGKIVTYYPSGAKAAEFSVGKAGKNIFYREDGSVIKEINDSEILTFARELTPMDCQETAVRLSLEDLVELYEDEGDISYNKCGLPYREAFVYEVVDNAGGAGIKASYDETGMIRRITPYQNGVKEGIQQKFDASGNVTAEISYHNDMKDGEANGYFPTGARAFHKKYEAGKVIDTLVCYFPTGEIAAEFRYENGLKEGTATISSPVSRELQFTKGKMQNAEQEETRQLASRLGGLEVLDERCLNVTDKSKELLAQIEEKAAAAENIYITEDAEECRDLNAYKQEDGQNVCYDAQNRLRAEFPAGTDTTGFLIVKIYGTDGIHQYDMPYVNQKRQGWAKQYDFEGNTVAEMYYHNGEAAESARRYYPNGVVKELVSQAEGADRKVIAAYNQDGSLNFNLNYKDGQKTQAFIADAAKNKDIYIRFYNGALDNIRETNAGKPQNYIEYNLALGEYTVNREGELIKGGHICSDRPEQPVKEELTPIGENELKALDEAALKAAAEYNLENALIPTAAEKKQAELAAKNIGPNAKPDLETLTDSVEKESLQPNQESAAADGLSKTEKFYYPNGNLRKTVKAKNGRTEEVKEYSKSGLLLTDTMYNKDNVVVEKYFGSGALRRKTVKNYDDNAVMAFVSREDFYDSGNPRYAVSRTSEVLLFAEKVYTPKGSLKQETEQKAPLSVIIKDYSKDEKLQKQTETLGANTIVKEYGEDGKLKSFSLNGKTMPPAMAEKSTDVLKENTKIYDKGVLKAEIKADKRQNTLVEYYTGKVIKTEIVFFNNGEITIKGYEKDGTLSKFAYLAPDGKLHIQKPAVRTIPNYRERYWIDYNNPNWVENQDKYSVKSISRLYLDTAAHILAELEWKVPEIMQKLYEVY